VCECQFVVFFVFLIKRLLFLREHVTRKTSVNDDDDDDDDQVCEKG